MWNAIGQELKRLVCNGTITSEIARLSLCTLKRLSSVCQKCRILFCHFSQFVSSVCKLTCGWISRLKVQKLVVLRSKWLVKVLQALRLFARRLRLYCAQGAVYQREPLPPTPLHLSPKTSPSSGYARPSGPSTSHVVTMETVKTGLR